MNNRFSGVADDVDAVVVGGGHAGIEAASALARLGFATMLVTQNLDAIGKMSCNPAIGGLAKGNIVREIDALGGEMAKLIDATMIQFRILNRSRGPAVQAPRAQADKHAYQNLAKQTLEQQSNLVLFQDCVVDLTCDATGSAVNGVVTERGRWIRARVVVLTTGTFLNGRIHIGEFTAASGRLGEPAAVGLERPLTRLGFRLGRLKTGTPARVHRDSLDLSQMEAQLGDPQTTPFSFGNDQVARPNLACYVTYTNAATHAIIRENIHRSPLYSGRIDATGARYCPSIEDKVVKFPDRDRHQIFVEPEGADTAEMYLNGISSSMPEDVQERFLHTVPGLQHAFVMRPGYAVEYDFVDPSQLLPSLESKPLAGLFIAGQTNGTSGYEEAAAQGLIAGINAGLKLRGLPPLVLSRAESYIGVMIDDLVTLGTSEPYRMFTSRAEYRMRLRHDSADQRLLEKGYRLGLQDDRAYERYTTKTTAMVELKRALANTRHEGRSFDQWLRMPHVDSDFLRSLDARVFEGYPIDWIRTVELDIKYAGYIDREDRQIARFLKMERLSIPTDIDYRSVTGLSNEAREKLTAVRPQSVGQAGRISGIRTGDIAVLIVHLTALRSRSNAGVAR